MSDISHEPGGSKSAQGPGYPLPPYGGQPYAQQPYAQPPYSQQHYLQQPYGQPPYGAQAYGQAYGQPLYPLQQQPYPPPYQPQNHPPPPQQSHQQPPPLPQSFSVCVSPEKTKSETAVIHPLGTPIRSPPLYSIVTHEYHKPNVILHRGGASQPNNIVAGARFHTLSSTTDLTLHGQAFTMHESTFSGSYTVECPGLGSFKWKSSDSGGGGMKLVDGSGNKVARIKSGKSSAREVDILIPRRAGDEKFVEMVLVTAAAAKILGQPSYALAGGILGYAVGAAC